jgi:hypothetical protein
MASMSYRVHLNAYQGHLYRTKLLTVVSECVSMYVR